MEFLCVGVGGLDAQETEGIEDDVCLTYVAITRATHEALVIYSNMSELAGRLVA